MRWPWKSRESELIRLLDLYLLDAARTRELLHKATEKAESDEGWTALPGGHEDGE